MKKLPRKTKELCGVLECLGFNLNVSSGRGGHYRYVHSTKKPVVANQPPFIMVPRHNFDTGHFHEMIHHQILMFGFTKEEIDNCC